VSSILEKCGDIDDAIRQLTSLKLTAERKAAAAEAATTVTDDAGERPNFPVHLTPRERTRPAGARRAGAPPTASHSRAPPASSGAIHGFQTRTRPPRFPHSRQIRDLRHRLTSPSHPSLHPRPAGDAHEQTQKEKHATALSEEARRAVEAAERKAADTQLASERAAHLEAAAPTTLSRDWVAALVQEMQSATDVDDAHARATRVMQAFEAAVRGAVAAEGEEGAGGAEGARRRSARLAEENLILKRAVAIQNARQQEHGELQRQLLELQRACAGYQEQLQAAQRQNYSLGVHLKEALSPQVPSHRNPDVF
jgi:hypothetical protein